MGTPHLGHFRVHTTGTGMAKGWGQRVQSLLSHWPRSVNASSLCPFPPVCFLWHFWVPFLHVAAGPHAQSRVAWRASVSLLATHLRRQRREASPGRAEPAGKLGHTVPESSKNYE